MSMVPPPPARPLQPFRGCSYAVALAFHIGTRELKPGEDFPLELVDGDEGMAIALWRTGRLTVKPLAPAAAAASEPAPPKQQGRAARR